MVSFLVANVVALTSAQCPLPFQIAGNEAAARAIAEIVIASAPKVPINRDILRYDLHISYVEQRESWQIHETPVSAVENVQILGGNGLSMEIAACNGAVSNVRRMR